MDSQTTLLPDASEIAVEANIYLGRGEAVTFFAHERGELAMKIVITALPTVRPCYSYADENAYANELNALPPTLIDITYPDGANRVHRLIRGEKIPYSSSTPDEYVDYLNEIMRIVWRRQLT